MSLIDNLKDYFSESENEKQEERSKFIYDLQSKPDGTGFKTFNGEQREIEQIAEVEKESGITEKEVFMGEYPRKMVEANYNDPTNPIFIGYKEEPSGTAREYGIDFERFFTHIGVFGTTGVGKSTLLKTMMIQLIYGGHGLVYIDPKGQDCEELLQYIPDERLDDVIYLEAEQSEDDEKTIGFNYLSVPVDSDHPYYNSFVSSRVDLVKDAVQAKQGPRMESVIDNAAKAMIRSEKNYTLSQLYLVLADEDRRKKFAEEVREELSPFIAEFTEKIAEMDDDDLEPLIRRIRDWTEKPGTRELVSHPESTISGREILENDRIVIVDADTGDKNALLRFYAMSIIEQIWAGVRQRPSLGQDPKPFFLFVDEFASLFRETNDPGKIGQILSEARSFKLSLTIATQSPNQIPSDFWKSEISENINTFIGLKSGSNGASALQQQFPEQNTQQFVNLPKYQSINRTETEDGVYSFRIKNFPDYPPLRSEDKIDDIKKDSLERYGEERLTQEEMEARAGFGDETTTEDTQESVTPLINATYYALLHSAQTTNKDTLKNTYVSENKVKTILDDISPTRDYAFSSLIEENGEYFELKRDETDTITLTLTDTGIGEAKSTSSGKAGSGGKSSHRYLLKQTREVLAQHGIATTIPTQGKGTQPDGLGTPLSIDTETEYNHAYLDRTMEQLKTEEIRIEAETSTFEKPYQSLTNLAKAYTENTHCLFTAKNEDDARKLQNILNTGYSRQYEDTARKLYNYNDTLKRDTKNNNTAYPLRPADSGRSTNWIEHNGEYYLVDSSSAPIDYDNAIAQFDSVDQVNKFNLEDFPAYYIYTNANGYTVYKNGQQINQYDSKEDLKTDWKRIKKPFILENEFGMNTTPTPDHYTILVIPPDNETPYIYDNGDHYPLTHDTDSKNKANNKNKTDTPTDNDTERPSDNPFL